MWIYIKLNNRTYWAYILWHFTFINIISNQIIMKITSISFLAFGPIIFLQTHSKLLLLPQEVDDFTHVAQFVKVMLLRHSFRPRTLLHLDLLRNYYNEISIFNAGILSTSKAIVTSSWYSPSEMKNSSHVFIFPVMSHIVILGIPLSPSLSVWKYLWVGFSLCIQCSLDSTVATVCLRVQVCVLICVWWAGKKWK